MNSGAEPVVLTGPDGSAVTLLMRYSARCHRIQMRALADGIELVVPDSVSKESALFFARTNFDWIRRALRHIAARQKRNPEVFPPDFIEFGFTGMRYPVRIIEQDVCWAGARINENELILTGRISDHDLCARVLRRWLIREAEKVLFPFAAGLAPACNVTVTRFRTGLQKRSWGTCTSKGVVTLNAALLFFRPALVRYVILHEFAHRYEMNHSPRFWAILEKWCPGAESLREELNHLSAGLPVWLWK